MKKKVRNIISILLENEPGALARVVGVFCARDFNIECLTVAKTHIESLSLITLVSEGDTQIIKQLIKQLNKLIDVFKVINLTSSEYIERELLLAKIAVKDKQIEIKQLIDIFGAKVISVNNKKFIIELSDKGKQIDLFLAAINDIDKKHILEVSRTGVTGILVKEKD